MKMFPVLGLVVNNHTKGLLGIISNIEQFAILGTTIRKFSQTSNTGRTAIKTRIEILLYTQSGITWAHYIISSLSGWGGCLPLSPDGANYSLRRWGAHDNQTYVLFCLFSHPPPPFNGRFEHHSYSRLLEEWSYCNVAYINIIVRT